MIAPDSQTPPPQHAGTIVNAMSIDVEDYFQVGAFESCIRREDWGGLPSRVTQNCHRILDLLAKKNVHATFFTLGWIAERHPDIIRRIVGEGHELASHGYQHERVHHFSPQQFHQDIARTKAILEDISGTRIIGYRAPSFSIGEKTLWAFDILAEHGYLYSSSIYPIRHDHYGWPAAPRFAFQPVPGLIEIPVTTIQFLGRTWPCGGGGFFRLFPYLLSHWTINRVNQRDTQSAMFYFHPWEIDPDQPVQHQAPLKSRIRHYVNLKAMHGKVARVLEDFAWDRVDRVYLNADKL